MNAGARRRVSSPARRRVRRLGACLAAACLAVMAAGMASPARVLRIQLDEGLAPPSLEHPLGQDRLGRDVLARTAAGARVSLAVAAGAVFVSLVVGTAAGAAAGFLGGTTDAVVMRVVDLFLAFPGLLLAIALAAALGPGAGNVVLALSVAGWTSYARLVRGETKRLRQREHVQAAIALGLPRRLVLWRHVLPLLAAPLAVQAAFGAAAAVLAESSLSFLGVGVPPPAPSWGSMLSEARGLVAEAPHLLLAPGLAITALVALLQMLGDALREWLDPRSADAP